MAITKIDTPNSVPSAVADYQLQNAHMMGFINQMNAQAFILTDPQGLSRPSIAQGSYLNHGGSLYVVDSGDEAISGSPSDGSVYVKLSGGATLTAEFITNISGYAYNPATGNIESGSNFILPYMIVKSGSEWRKYRWEISNGLRVGTLEVDGAIKGATIDTGQGAVEAYAMNQPVRTTDNVTFATVNTGQGAVEAYAMNQAVRTIDNPVFGWRTADDIITLKDVRLRYHSLGAGGEGAVYGESQFDTAMTTSTSYVKRASFKISDVLNRVAPQNGITGARIRFSVSNLQGGTTGRGGCKIVVGGVVKYEDTYNTSHITVAHDVSLTSEDIIEVWIRFISGGQGTRISTSSERGVSFSRALTPIEALFEPMGV